MTNDSIEMDNSIASIEMHVIHEQFVDRLSILFYELIFRQLQTVSVQR